jgi:hypothetical protein
MKKCTKCKEVKPLTEFRKNKNTTDGYYGWCAPCLSAYNKARGKAAWAEKKKAREMGFFAVLLIFLLGCEKPPITPDVYKYDVEYASVYDGCGKPTITYVFSVDNVQHIEQGTANRWSYRFKTNLPQKLKLQSPDCLVNLKIYVNGRLVQQNTLAQWDPQTIYYWME